MTYLGRVTVIQHALVGMQFYDMPWSGCSFTTCPGADAAIRNSLIGTSLFNMSWSGRSFTACPGQDAVL